MTDVAPRVVEEAAEHVRPDWSPARARRVEAMMLRTRTRRARVKAGLAIAAVFALGFGGFSAYRSRTHRAEVVAKPSPSAAAVPGITFADGSQAVPIGEGSVVTSTSVSPEKIEVAVVRGAARFEVTKNPQRLFRVTRDNAIVEVLGTGFTVEPIDDGTKVTVVHGRVRVRCVLGAEEKQVEIADGQSSECPAKAPLAPVVVAPSASSVVAPSAPGWRSLAHDGEYDKAYSALDSATVKDDVGDLLLAADVARLSHHAAQAVPHLRRVVDKHEGDPRAPLAAFTLGRVQLEELGNPRDAATSFAKARSLAPSGQLAEDALAREVEALSKAGDPAKAKERAEEYVTRYPKGLRLRSVKKFGGLDQ
jgi:transmembrane sensor